MKFSASAEPEFVYSVPSPQQCEQMGFWELFDAVSNYWITALPLAEVTPVLRVIIDKQWQDDREAPPAELVGDIQERIVSLLYYAWDRAREVQTLQAKLHRKEQELARMTALAATPISRH
jgi:hypothetical protein